MIVNFSKIIRDATEPKFAYHGFKYNDERSHPQLGHYSFTRTYWGKSQCVNIGRVEYHAEDLASLFAEGEDIPTEVAREQLPIKEPGYRLWLSNRYLNVVVGHEGGFMNLTRTGVGIPAAFAQLAGLPFDEAHPIRRNLYREHLWWKFRNEWELREALGGIVGVFLGGGLEWHERQVAEIRRHHEKLDARRAALKKEGRS